MKLLIQKNGIDFTKIELKKPVTIKQAIIDLELKPEEKLCYYVNGIKKLSNEMIEESSTLNIIGIESLEGHRIYQDTATFILMKAFHNLYPPEAKLVAEHSIGDGIYFEVFGYKQSTAKQCTELETEMNRICAENLSIKPQELSYNEVKSIFNENGRKDLIRNLKYLYGSYEHMPNIYRCGQYFDYFIRELSEKTGSISKFKVQYQKPGILLRFPPLGKTEVVEENHIPKKLFKIHQEYDKWLTILKSHNVADLNRYIAKYEIQNFIHVEEALQEKKIAYFADSIAQKQSAKLILIAGPSSSGKTTFAKRLSIQLMVNGLQPVVIGLDDYFLDRDKTPRTPSGEYDFETIEALDLPLLNNHLQQILSGNEIEVPRYNFVTGKSEPGHKKIKLHENQVLVLEGIHAINEKLTATIPADQKIKIYISNLNQLNIDRHNRIPTTDSRKIRRISRDNLYRGYSVEDTLMRWESIRAGEEKHIFPFQEQADLMFNSGLTYEMAVLKKYVKPLLIKVSKNSPVYNEAQRLSRLLDHMLDIPDEFVPNDSLIREFTKGSIFKY